MQVALHPGWVGHARGAGRSYAATRVNRFMAAGVAMVGASLIAANPLAPSVASDVVHRIEHRAVQLTSGIGDVLDDYESVINQAGANLQTLGSEASGAYGGLFNQIGANLSGSGNLINTAVSGTQTGIQNALYSGWYGGDDGYVFGLFGGSLTHAGVTKTGSTLQEIMSSLAQGNLFDAYGYYDEWSLEALQHITKPMLSPILSTSKVGSPPTPTIPAQMLQTFTNMTETALNYNNLQALADALLSPQLSVTFGYLADLDTIGTDLSAGNFGGALTQVLKMPADLTGDLLNGYVYPSAAFNPSGEAFTGLLNNGSLLQLLLYTWPNELTAALSGSSTGSVASASAQAVSPLGGGLSQAAPLLANLAKSVRPSLQLANLGAALSPLVANIAAQLSATLAPNVISGLLLHLPALLLALL